MTRLNAMKTALFVRVVAIPKRGGILLLPLIADGSVKAFTHARRETGQVITHLLSRAAVRAFFTSSRSCNGYTVPGNASNRGPSGKRDWWLRSERAHIGAAKPAPLTERLAGDVAPNGIRLKAHLAKARCVHQTGYRENKHG